MKEQAILQRRQEEKIDPLWEAWRTANTEAAQAAELLYQNHPRATIKEVMARFRVSRATVNKALLENDIVVDRYPNPIMQGRTYRSHICPRCRERYRHYCKPQPFASTSSL